MLQTQLFEPFELGDVELASQLIRRSARVVGILLFFHFPATNCDDFIVRTVRH